jgi:hypothetical protein
MLCACKHVRAVKKKKIRDKRTMLRHCSRLVAALACQQLSSVEAQTVTIDLYTSQPGVSPGLSIRFASDAPAEVR